jgi:hypothetical protein
MHIASGLLRYPDGGLPIDVGSGGSRFSLAAVSLSSDSMSLEVAES